MPSGESQIMAKKHAIEQRRLYCEYRVIQAAKRFIHFPGSYGREPLLLAVLALEAVEKEAKEAEGT